MSFCFFASQLHRSSKLAKRLRSCVLTAHTHSFVGVPRQDSVSNNHNPRNPVDVLLFAQILRHGSFSNPYFLNKIISLCAKSASNTGIKFHSTIIKTGFASNLYICSAAIDMYAKCGEIGSAQKLFDEMPQRNDVTWNSLISGYLKVDCPKIAVELFVKMLREIVDVAPFSVSACLVGCLQLEAGGLGAQVHALSMKAGFDCNVVVGTALINMYSKCSYIDDSRRAFDHMVDKNVVTWTSMVTAYAQNEQPDEAMILVREMARLGIKSNYVTYSSLLTSFSGPEYLEYCKQVHSCIIRHGFEANVYVAVTLVTVYSKCNDNVEDFRKLWSGVTIWDQISWNAAIAGYSNLGCCRDAIKCFLEMGKAGINMDFYTFTSVLGAIGDISAIGEGRETHALILKTGYNSDVSVQNGLVSMYARCGAINDSKRVFWWMEKRDMVSWNALLTGCANHGYGWEAMELFDQMRKTKIKPDSTTFLAVLSACGHTGFVDKGLEYLDLMKSDVSLEPLRVEHYATVVDIFGRAGYLNEAEAIVNSMPIERGPSVYKALLSACLIHGNKEIATRSAKKLLELWPNDPTTYVLLSNVLAVGGCWDDAADVRKLMCERGVRKKPGFSWI